jgi:hypothetical protein
MKIKIFITFVVLLVFACQASATSVWINSVSVVPSQPSDTDLITFNVFGKACQASSWVDHNQFSQDGTSLQLDLYVDYGDETAFSNWNYSKQIQPLTPATYSLEVRTFDYQSGSPWFGTLQDTHTVDFTVTPEPSTFAILGFGLPFFRTFLRRKI